jgi:catechol 2,3-dioxygenase-like lactoylglutathione lyase family enzyme
MSRLSHAGKIYSREIVLPGGLPRSMMAPTKSRVFRERNTMPNYQWDHVHLRSPDPDATAQWFERVLGAQVLRTMQQGKPRVDLKLGGANIFIAPVASGDGVNSPPKTPYQGLDHFGLTVSNLDEVVTDLKKKGVEFTMEPNVPRPGIKICFLRGPQGISIELLDRDP